MPATWIDRLRRKSPPDLWRLTLDAREVMRTRIARGLAGTLTATEARRMVLEKGSAGVRAQLAYAQAVLEGNLESAARAFFDAYHREVRSNRRRLRKPWWGRPIARWINRH
jgi:hypothetical protein